MDLKSVPFLEIPIIKPEIEVTKHDDGRVYFKSKEKLQPHPYKLTSRLIKWANEKPESTFIAKRAEDGNWINLTYGEAYKKAQHLGQYLLDSGANAENPIIILSANSLEMAVVILAALHVGIPFSPISPAYSTMSTDFVKLKHCIELLTPGLIFIQDGDEYGRALEAISKDIKILCVDNVKKGQDHYSDAINTEITSAVQHSHQSIHPDTIAKILFTSGSTGMPKGVKNTHGNITTNEQQTLQTFPFMADGGFRLIDWLPWHHTFGGNNNFGMTLYTGGSLHMDDGRPTPKGIHETIRNLKEIAPTVYYNVPKGFEEMLPYLEADSELCKTFFSNMKMFFYAGASMPQHVWDGLERLAANTIGKRIFIGTGLGMTESSPSCMFNVRMGAEAGELGVPVPELTAKLVPDEDKLEVRFKGKNLFPGYWRNEEATKKAFDEEGFYKTGDAVRIIDKNDLTKGMRFNGRIAENFKMATGTWVNVGGLRSKLIKIGKGLIVDAVITGHDKLYLGAIIIPELNYCRKLAGLSEDTAVSEVVSNAMVHEALQNLINEVGNQRTGSSTYVKKAIFADFELSLDKGEITDKGSINQRAILRNRPELLDLLYNDISNESIIEYRKKQYA